MGKYFICVYPGVLGYAYCCLKDVHPGIHRMKGSSVHKTKSPSIHRTKGPGVHRTKGPSVHTLGIMKS